jgi:hypothetical protein
MRRLTLFLSHCFCDVNEKMGAPLDIPYPSINKYPFNLQPELFKHLWIQHTKKFQGDKF